MVLLSLSRYPIEKRGGSQRENEICLSFIFRWKERNTLNWCCAEVDLILFLLVRNQWKNLLFELVGVMFFIVLFCSLLCEFAKPTQRMMLCSSFLTFRLFCSSNFHAKAIRFTSEWRRWYSRCPNWLNEEEATEKKKNQTKNKLNRWLGRLNCCVSTRTESNEIGYDDDAMTAAMMMGKTPMKTRNKNSHRIRLGFDSIVISSKGDWNENSHKPIIPMRASIITIIVECVSAENIIQKREL